MMSIPIPFVVAMLLAVLALINHHRLKETPTGTLFAVVLWLYIASEILIGLRWVLDKVSLMPFAAVLTISGIVLLYLAFMSLGRRGPIISWARDWPHAIPVGLTVVGSMSFFELVEIVLIATKVIYSGLLIQLARHAPDSLRFVRLGRLKDAQRALWGVAMLLLFSIVIDVAISIDFALYEGQHAARLVGYANLIMLLPMGLACVIVGGEPITNTRDENSEELELSPISSTKQAATLSEFDSIDSNNNEDDGETSAILSHLNELLIDEKLYSDTELNLQRLARKAGVPSRAVSRAINSQTGLNMSQWVNNARIEAACAMLKQSDITIGQAMFESGFTTKSNFNREFRRVTGSNPSDWRQKNGMG